MGRPRAGIHLDLADVFGSLGISPEEFLNAVCSGKKRFRLSAVFDPRNSSENNTGRNFQRLAKARLMENQERGTDNLFLAWPFVLGQWPDGSFLRTPFQFIPVDLVQDGRFWWIEARPESAIINPAFMLAYAHHTGKGLDTELFEKELGIEAADAREYLTRFYEILRDSHLEVNFNSDLFTLKLSGFLPVRKDEFPALIGLGVIKLQPHALLGLFSLSDSLLLPDFDWLEKNNQTLETLFLKETQAEKQISEKDLLFPLPADGSQEECLRAILSGKNLKIQGPPGTGKSQLIANLIAASAASGKSVLLVCQKKVALEVVHRRLEECGIGRHVALWADFRNDLGGLYAALARQIEELEETEFRNKSLDTVILEREYLRHSQEISKISDDLDRWKDALFDESLAEISWFGLQERLAAKRSSIQFPGFADFRLSGWEEFLRWADRHGGEFLAGRPAGSILLHRSVWPSTRSAEMLEELDKMVSDELKMKQFIQESGCWDFDSISHLEETSRQFPEPEALFAGMHPDEVLSEQFIISLEKSANELNELLQYFSGWPSGLDSTEKSLKELYGLQMQTKEINPFILRIKSLFQSKWRMYRKSMRQLKSAGFGNPHYAIESGIRFFRISCTHSLFHGLSFSPALRTETEARLAIIPQLLENLRMQSGFYQQVKKYLNAILLQDLQELTSFARRFAKLFEIRNSALKQLALLFPAVSPEETLRRLLTESEQWKAKKDQILTSDKLLEGLPSHWQLALLYFAEQLKGLPAEEMDAAWGKSWLHEMENRYPVLSYKEEYFHKEISALQESIRRKQLLARDFLCLRVEEETHRDVVRNRLQNRITYRGLYHQVSKKRQRLPLRKLWEMHGEEILKFIPCWLATPESVSATWPMEMKFDLVVFDEASQCFAEKGIPSLARGKQVVIIGDGKQLPPNQLFSARWEEHSDEEELLYSQQDSLLDLAGQFYPSRMLKSHYRSIYPELIDFSNRHFYDDKLLVFPSPETLSGRNPAIRFKKVNGVWKNQCNPAEAEWIAENAIRFFRENPSDTLGIISFNIRQQEKIEEEVLACSIRESVVIPDWFFVKNIENVQGDERDHIWFSVAYARSETGKMISQFGSLGTEGGENRLNVAISRARKGITVVSSLLPSELTFTGMRAKGLVLLAEYLNFVFSSGMKVQVPAEQAAGSLLKLADQIQQEENGYSLVFSNLSGLYKEKSMKTRFGLMPVFLKSLGYGIRFRYWEKGNFD